MKKVKMNIAKCFCFLLIAATSACTGEKSNTEEKLINVKAVKVSASNEVYEKEYIGTIESENVADISFQVSGNVNKVYVSEGQTVQKGQILASLDETSLYHTYTNAKASLNQAEDAFRRQKMLYDNNSLPEIKYVEVKTNLEQAKASEQIARKNLADCKVYAPFSGVIGTKSVEVGTNVMPGAQIMTLMNIGTVKVKVAIPENNISAIQIGDECNVKITAMNNQEFSGKVIEKGIVSHPISHTYDIKVQLNNESKDIMPGMVCKAYLMGKYNQGILIPLKAIQIDFAGKNYVWVVTSENKAECKFITTGEMIDNDILIESGLVNGDMVVTEGYHKLSPSVNVKLNEQN